MSFLDFIISKINSNFTKKRFRTGLIAAIRDAIHNHKKKRKELLKYLKKYPESDSRTIYPLIQGIHQTCSLHSSCQANLSSEVLSQVYEFHWKKLIANFPRSCDSILELLKSDQIELPTLREECEAKKKELDEQKNRV